MAVFPSMKNYQIVLSFMLHFMIKNGYSGQILTEKSILVKFKSLFTFQMNKVSKLENLSSKSLVYLISASGTIS